MSHPWRLPMARSARGTADFAPFRSSERSGWMRVISCLGILRLARAYPAERMEAAAQRALRARAYNFKSMDSILKNQLDRLPLPSPPPSSPAVEHGNIRGADYYDFPRRASL